LNDYFLSIHKKKTEVLQSIPAIEENLGHFEAVNFYLKQLKSASPSENKLLKFLEGHSSSQKDEVEMIFKKFYPHLKKISRIITLSRSGTVFEILKLWHQKNKSISVVVCESRPKFEGRLMAQALASAGIRTELITDAMIAIYSRKVDAAIIGADAILKNGNVVNKVGSKSLALLCKEYEKPFFVVSTKSKISSSNKFQPENEDTKEVFNKKIKNLSVSNIYFEEIEKKSITKIFTS
jgi:translation initiation factor eIF-2B subunit delta